MVHLKIVLDTRRKKSDGSYPIVLRVTNVKKVHLISSGHSINDVDWDASKLSVKNSHPNSSSINLSLSKRYYEVQKAILKLEDASNFSFESLKSELNLRAVYRNTMWENTQHYLEDAVNIEPNMNDHYNYFRGRLKTAKAENMMIVEEPPFPFE